MENVRVFIASFGAGHLHFVRTLFSLLVSGCILAFCRDVSLVEDGRIGSL